MRGLLIAASGVAGDQRARVEREGWREIGWPFRRDGWPVRRVSAGRLCFTASGTPLS